MLKLKIDQYKNYDLDINLGWVNLSSAINPRLFKDEEEFLDYFTSSNFIKEYLNVKFIPVENLILCNEIEYKTLFNRNLYELVDLRSFYVEYVLNSILGENGREVLLLIKNNIKDSHT